MESVYFNEKNTYIKISIITVSYNAVRTIEQTILSVINQTYPNIEYIIIDGGSTDGTVDIIKKHQDKIAYWVSEPDKGIYDAMNKGVKASRGEYLYFLGADDCLTSQEIITEISAYLSQDEKIDVLSGEIWIIDECYNIQKVLENKVSKEWLESGYMIPHQGMFVRRTLMVKYPFNEQLRIAADYEFFLQAFLDSSVTFQYIDTTVAYFALSGISAKEDRKRIQEHIQVMKKFFDKETAEKYGYYYLKKRGILVRVFKEVCKLTLEKIGLLKQINLKRGWQVHSCDNIICRWCDRFDKR